jgi:hypothetical protein
MEISKNKKACKHDYKNAIRVSAIDYVCPICGKLLDPLEWFLMNNFEFVDVEAGIVKKPKKVANKGNYLESEGNKRLK